MTIYEVVLLNTIYLILPIVIYIFFAAHNKSIEKEENDLFFDASLMTSLYFIIRFGQSIGPFKLALIINIPLIIAYANKKEIIALALSMLIVVYNYKEFNYDIYLLIMEYILYFVLYFWYKETNVSKNFFIFLFMIMNIVIFTINKYNGEYYDALIQIMIFIVMYGTIKTIMSRADKVLRFHMTIKEIEQEKQIRDSLFKITHEIKNPLAVCKGYLDMFDIENIDHSRKYIPIIKEEIRKTLILLHDFLSFTKIKIEKDILDINMLLEETLENIEPLLENHKIEIINKISDDEIYINGDYNRLCQVIINVLKNSIEALENKNNPKITISSLIKDDYVEIVIFDNGVGIEEENLKNISKPFFTTKQSGTGLGVFMAYEIVKSHDGKIEYFSKYLKGTKVIIKLPLEKELNYNCAL